MKFVDEALIRVQAGKGGDGCVSFRREKFIPFGGPNGGDGGNGGSIYLLADHHLTTLVDFRFNRNIQAKSGQSGMGSQSTGKSSDNIYVKVPVGTIVKDSDTDELIGDLVKKNQTLLVAKGGVHGLGNTRFKSSTNRAPRKFTKGTPGEERNLYLELKLLADVGLLGLPNAGKSTLIRSISAARPKVADYPFTTLYPNLGVVSVEQYRSFVVADIPGVIEGAAEGAGLGIQFLKHVARTRLILHLVDISFSDAQKLPEDAIIKIESELQRFDKDLAAKPRWLVFNKIDLMSSDEVEEHCQRIQNALGRNDSVYPISAQTGEGTKKLIYDIMEHLEANSGVADEAVLNNTKL